jgi:glycosyltransferase involved in cell wall biosynthesis
MRVLSITAGAGEMYCGSCLRDNALAAELLRQGHDVTLLPVYTPTRTDEANVSQDRVFLGGISVYLEQHVPLFRRTPAVLDRLWDSAAALRFATGRGVSTDPKHLGELTVSMLRGEEGFQRKEIVKLVEHLRTLPPFDVVSLPNSLLLGLAPALKRALGRPLSCTLQGEDLFLEGLPEPHRSLAMELIRRHAPLVDVFVAVSDYYAGFMRRYLDLPLEKIRVAPLGVGPAGLSPRTPPARFTVGYLARVAPEKGLHLLAEAYRMLRAEGRLAGAKLQAAGYLAPEHRAYLAGVEARMAEAGLAAEFEYRGTLDLAEKTAFLRELSLLSVPSPYVEPKGLYLLEALACGVPVVQPRHGSFPEMIALTEGGLLFEPGDPRALADAILALHDDAPRAAEMGRRGAQGVARHYGVGLMAGRVLDVWRGLASAPAC